jgi:FixJ family two-component response regulator
VGGGQGGGRGAEGYGPIIVSQAPPSATIAVIEDDEGVRRALARLLRATGYTVQTYGSAEEFLTTGRASPADCLIVDVYLGAMNGFELHAELTATGSAPPTVFVTAHDEPVGDRICLRKPFEDGTLLETISGLLRSTV